MRKKLILCAVLTIAFGGTLFAQANVETEAQTLLRNNAWERALRILENTSSAKTEPALRELLAMAYLYTSTSIDSLANGPKARELMRQNVEQGGKARFYVGLGRNDGQDVHMLDTTPGELALTSSFIEFRPLNDFPGEVQRWEKKDVKECGLNDKYGKSSNSFHLTVTKDRKDVKLNFRPLQFSLEEAELICSLSGAPAKPGSK